MRYRTMLLRRWMIAAMVAAGCARSPARPPAPANNGSSTPARTVACHLACSGAEKTEIAETEEEARAEVTKHVDATCKPEDGQYFIFCDPPS